MLSHTKLASTMADASLRQIETLAPGQLLFETRTDADLDLHVVLRGDLRLHRDRGPRDVWLGPGDIVGEIGFVLGTPRTADVRAGDGGAAVWHVERGRFLGQPPA